MDLIKIGEQIGKTIDGKKGAKIGKAIGKIFQEAIPIIVQASIERYELVGDGSKNREIHKKKNKITKVGFTIE